MGRFTTIIPRECAFDTGILAAKYFADRRYSTGGMKLSRIFNANNIWRFIYLTFIVAIVFTSVQIYFAPTIASPSEISVRVKGDYTLMLFQCILGFFAMMLPHRLKRKVGLNIPSAMLIAYAVFLYCAIYLGEVRAFYYNVPHWDTVLHMFSGVALGAIGFSIVSLLNVSEPVSFSLSPAFVALFAFCFALALGVIWEIYEFAADFFLGTNMQKYALENGDLLIGKNALLDTMKDLIVDAIGSLAVSIVGYVSLKYEKGWLDRFSLKRN